MADAGPEAEREVEDVDAAPEAAEVEPPPGCPGPMLGRVEDEECGRAGLPPMRKHRPVLMLAACWMLTLSMMGGGTYAVVHWRDAISHRWPPSQRVYALLPAV